MIARLVAELLTVAALAGLLVFDLFFLCSCGCGRPAGTHTPPRSFR